MFESSIIVNPEAIRTMFGGKWPESNFGAWREIVEFRSLAPGSLQGFDSYGEPIGPEIGFSVRILRN